MCHFYAFCCIFHVSVPVVAVIHVVHSTNTIITSDGYKLSAIILFSDTGSIVSPYISCQSEGRVFSFVRNQICVCVCVCLTWNSCKYWPDKHVLHLQLSAEKVSRCLWFVYGQLSK